MEQIEQNENENIAPKRCGCNGSGCRKLSVTNWLDDVSVPGKGADFVEVQFKNTRKGFFINNNNLPLKEGDIVAVETSPGHDIGYVTLVGELVLKQMRKNHVSQERYEFKRVYRLAKPSDIEKWDAVKEKEHPTMIRSREIAKKLELDMKIGDVEFQGDGNKAIFYYIADKRVDFRQLIKDLASEFSVRIEMRQIGARQEAGQIGGIGPCGREICCSKWNTNFASVNTSAARIQELSLNPEKLTGMCGKLKCCLNYEVDMYNEALKDFPSKNKKLESEEGVFRHVKNDALKGAITYVLNKREGIPLFAVVSKERAKEVIAMNNNGDRPERLIEDVIIKEDITPTYENVVGQDDLTRFDKNIKAKKRRPKKRKPKDGAAPKGTVKTNVSQKPTGANKSHKRRDSKPGDPSKDRKKVISEKKEIKKHHPKRKDNKSAEGKKQDGKPNVAKHKAGKPNPNKRKDGKPNNPQRKDGGKPTDGKKKEGRPANKRRPEGKPKAPQNDKTDK